MRNYPVFLAALLVLMSALAGCATTQLADEAIDDTVDLIDYLKEKGIGADHVGVVTRPAFTQDGKLYRLLGSDLLHVYEYEYEEAAQTDRNLLMQGAVRASNPHYYHSGKLIVVYFGQKTEVKLALAKVLGTRLT